MKPGQANIGLNGALGTAEAGGHPAQLMASVEAPFTDRWSAAAWFGVSHDPMGHTGLLDATVTAPATLAAGETVVARIAPGLSLPIGATGMDGVATFRSSGSVDPVVSADIVGGGTMVGLATVFVRAPVWKGRDDLRDGVFLRTDAMGGARVGRFVPMAGLSWLRQGDDETDARGYDELSIVAGSTVNLGQHWGLDARVRIPVMGDHPPAALILGATRVVGKPPSSH